MRARLTAVTLSAQSPPDARPEASEPDREASSPIAFITVIGVATLVVILCGLGATMSGLFDFAKGSATPAAAIVDDNGTITSGGVSLAIDGTLYILGKLYGEVIRDEIASIIEYDRAFAANRKALQHLKI